jgi:8-amino-7-oxononanoate synthase
MDKAATLSLAEKQALLKRVLEARRAGASAALSPAAATPTALEGDDTPASFFRIEDFPRYRQMQLHRELADRVGLENPFFTLHEGVGRDTTVIDGRKRLNFSTYNYLGLNGDERVNRAAAEAAEKFGTSASSSRIVGGERPPHRALETALAALHGVEDAVIFVSGYVANLSIVATLVGPKDAVVMDRAIHNSIAQGAKLSGAAIHTFPHNDWRALDALLANIRARYERVLVAVEGVYSMDGDLAPVDRLVEMRDRHKILLMVDEAHSLGALGARGRGVGEHFGLSGSDVDVWMGTLSKTLAGCGGYAAGSRALIDLLKFTAPGFVYSVGMPPPMAAASTEALQIMLAEPERVARLKQNGRLFADHARARGLNIGASGGLNIVPVIVGGSVLAARLANALMRRDIQVQPIVYPAVEEGAARLRFFLSSDHTADQLRTAVEATAEELAALR